MDTLAQYNATRRQQIETGAGEIAADRAARGEPARDAYPLGALTRLLESRLGAAVGKPDLSIDLSLIDRAKFGGDVVLKFPELLKMGGPKRFIAEFQPLIDARLREDDLAGVIKAIDLRGMYVNLTLQDRWVLGLAQQVIDTGGAFGRSDALSGRRHVVDYSSPNIAKVLHAGHIRSTIAGHILSNLLDACGGTVFRVNHINDFGGFGFLLEGWRRFADRFPAMGENDRLLEIYRIRRSVERLTGEGLAAADWPEEERALVARYFPEAHDLDALRTAFAEYTEASDARFAALEKGAAEEVELWQKMVEWSLRDFAGFYEDLAVDFDFIIGESFYAQAGDALVDEAIAKGTATILTAEEAGAEIDTTRALAEAGEITDAEAETRIRGIEKDIGAAVVPLDSGERYVVRKSNGLGIYATRDLGAIDLRNRMFDPDGVIYVVGQEQRSHFERLFAAAEKLELVQDGRPDLNHVYFGFYTDAATGKKLSSRNSVAGVMQLITGAQDYFRARLDERGTMSAEEADRAARQLTIGSLVFNDLKQDLKGSVEIDPGNIAETVAKFEKAGGAYLVYTACRARSILRRYEGPEVSLDLIDNVALDDQETQLLLRLQQIPERVVWSAERTDPSALIQHLLDVAKIYNSYYTRAKVIEDGIADPARLLITQAVATALIAALDICHITCPEQI